MTGELRESLAKLAKSHAERAKVGVRKARQRGMADLKKNKSVSEDTVRRLEKYVGGGGGVESARLGLGQQFTPCCAASKIVQNAVWSELWLTITGLTRVDHGRDLIY